MITLPGNPIGDLSDALNTVATGIKAFVKSAGDTKQVPAPNNVLKSLIVQLNAQDKYATSSLQNFLAMPQTGDITQLEAAIVLVRTYLQTTTFMDRLPGIAKLDLIKGSSVADEYVALHTERKNLRELLDNMHADQTDELAALVDDSAALTHPPIAIDKLLNHLSEARTVLTRLRVDEIEQDDAQISHLIENWQSALTQLPKSSDAVSEHDRRAAVSKTLALHELLEAIYGILSGDISAAAPLDLAIL